MDFETRTVRLDRWDLDFEVLADDAIIGPAIARGSWADDETRLMLAHIAPGSRVVDLGANVGWFAVQAILAGADVDAFEPVPGIAAVARRNIERALDKGRGSARVHVLAAGREPGEATIALSANNHGDNRVVEGSDAPDDMGGAELVTIQIARLDDVLTGPVRFLKVDTQGSEWLALTGARRLLETSPDLALLIELWPYALREASAKQLLDLLFDAGFQLGKATNAPYPMSRDRILAHLALRTDPVKGGIDLYGVRGRLPFHVLGAAARLRALARSVKEP